MKNLHVFGLLAAAGMLAYGVNAAAALAPHHATKAKPFKVFSAWKYPDTPQSVRDKFAQLKIFYESSLTGSKSPGRGRMVRTFNAKKIEGAAAASRSAGNTLVVLDMESWGFGDSGVHGYARSLKVFKKKAPDVTVGMYDYVPFDNILVYRAVATGDSKAKVRWERLQDRMMPIAKIVDVSLPSLYTWGTNIKAWKKTAEIVVSKAKAMNPGKPVYAFIWPQYYGSVHGHNRNKKALQFIDAKTWRTELETLYRIADGVIIWSSNKDANGNIIKFNTQMPWYVTTIDFMVSHGIQANNEDAQDVN